MLFKRDLYFKFLLTVLISLYLTHLPKLSHTERDLKYMTKLKYHIPTLLETSVFLTTNNSIIVKQMEMYSKRVFVFLLTEKGISEFFTDGIIHC